MLLTATTTGVFAMADDTNRNGANRPESPRFEPEIIPPGQGNPSDWRQPSWRGSIFTQSAGTHRVFVTRLGPFGIALLILAAAAIGAIALIAILGAFLVWIPVVAVLVVIAAIFRFLRS